MTTPPLAQVPVRSAAELTRRWADLLDPPVFATRSLWLMWLTTDGRSLPLIVPIDDLPAVPDLLTLRGLADFHEAVTEGMDVAHLAVALCRPGPAGVIDDDEDWAEALSDLLPDRIECAWSLHLAASGRVVPVVEPPAWRLPTARCPGSRRSGVPEALAQPLVEGAEMVLGGDEHPTAGVGA